MDAPRPVETHRALVVGGLPRFVEQTIAPKLALFGISIEVHWPVEGGRHRTSVPPDVDLVIVFLDWSSAAQRASSLKADCDRLEIPYVSTLRKLSNFQRDLELRGFKRLPVAVADALATPPMPEPTVPEKPLAVVPQKFSALLVSDEALDTAHWTQKHTLLKLVLRSMRADGLHTLLLSEDGTLELTRTQTVETSEALE